MISPKRYQKNGEAGGAMQFQIVIESEEPTDSQTMLCLRVDTQVIAKNLTIAQMKFLVGEILDRISVYEVEKETESIERQLN
jgi:hypothetical protein